VLNRWCTPTRGRLTVLYLRGLLPFVQMFTRGQLMVYMPATDRSGLQGPCYRRVPLVNYI